MDVMSFEKDLLTGKLLSHLYPDNKVRIEGFERIESRYNNYFDVVSSNIPFGDVSTFDPAFIHSTEKVRQQSARAIHNYFFVKGLDTLREGGVLDFITSQGVMNSPQNEPIRRLLMQNSNLVSAIRLPNNLFFDSANTEVGSDLIILQKNSNKQQLSSIEYKFIESRLSENGITTNCYFEDYSRIVYTQYSVDTDPYGKPAMVFKHEGGAMGIAKDMTQMLKADFAERLNMELYNSMKTSQNEVIAPITNVSSTEKKKQEQTAPKQESLQTAKPQAPLITLYDLFGMTVEERVQNKRAKRSKSQQTLKSQPSLFDTKNADNEGSAENSKIESRAAQPAKPQSPPISMEPRDWTQTLKSFYKDGSLVREDNGQIGYLKDIHTYGATFYPLALNPVQKAKAELYLQIRDSYQYLYLYEANERKENKEYRDSLNKFYDDYKAQYGYLNAKDNSKLIMMDASGRDILSLERVIKGQFVKADILGHPVAFSLNEFNQVDTSEEALSASLNKYGDVNLDYMALLSGVSVDELVVELKGRIYFNPLVDNYEIADRFIAGNVVEKQELIESWLLDNPHSERVDESLNALKEATPRPITFDELDFSVCFLSFQYGCEDFLFGESG